MTEAEIVTAVQAAHRESNEYLKRLAAHIETLSSTPTTDDPEAQLERMQKLTRALKNLMEVMEGLVTVSVTLEPALAAARASESQP